MLILVEQRLKMKKIAISVAILLLVVTGGLVYIWSSLDDLVKEAIETFGSEATGTQVSVSDVKITLKTGQGEVRDLRVGNPAGFSAPDIFELGMISIRIDPTTLTRNPIIIDEIIIRSPSVFYEINKSGISNVDVLKKNLRPAGRGEQTADKSTDEGKVKMIIRNLLVEDGKATVRVAALGEKVQTIKLPPIRLIDVGKKSGGATAAEIARILSRKLLKNVQKAVVGVGVRRYLGKKAGKLGQGAGGIAEKAGKTLKGLLGN